MIASDLETGIDRLRECLARSKVMAPFTGAGISTECGIPDFRSPGGLWTKMSPIGFDAFRGSQDMRDEAWRRRFAMQERFGQARPGRGHRALAQFHRAGRAPAIITQNIDNLHQASGIAEEHVIELHGNTTYATCLDCARRYTLGWVSERFEAAGGRAPDCPDCGGHIKSATISFGQAMPPAAMRAAEKITAACDLFLAIGSSLAVWPAAGFPLTAKRNGAVLVIINREPTDFDDIADLVIRADIGATLQPFAAD
ncbi:MAG: NAD-dependent deacetylase [Proteobacteria bacterium]|nr:NAD-dependent deacetylase [Pseudomonadota bacterium]